MKFSEMDEKEKVLFILGSALILVSILSKDCFDLLFGSLTLSSIWFDILYNKLEDLEENIDDIKEQLVSLNDFFIDCSDE